MSKYQIHELLRQGVLQCYCVGFRPSDQRLKEFDLTLGSTREVESDPGGHHAVIPVFAKDESGNDKETVILIDTKYTDENAYTPLAGNYDDVLLHREVASFVEYYGNDEVDLGLGEIEYTRSKDLNH